MEYTMGPDVWKTIGGLPATKAFVCKTMVQNSRIFSDYDYTKGGRLLEDPVTSSKERFLANVEELKRTEVQKRTIHIGVVNAQLVDLSEDE